MKTFVKKTAYSTLLVGELDDPATTVKTELYSHVLVFVTPPITEVVFGGLITVYVAKFNAHQNGGSAAYGEFLEAETDLLNAMDVLAEYVDTVADGVRSIVLQSGFVPTKEEGSPSVTPTELTGITLTRGATGEIFSICDKQIGVEAYKCIITAGAPLPSSVTISGTGQMSLDAGVFGGGGPNVLAFDLTKKRKKKFMNLTPGVIYYFTYFGINSAGVGPLSTPVSIMCA